MKSIYILITLILSTLNFYSQNFKGKIMDKSGQPLYGSSVYIKEINQGLVCNEDGFFQTTLAPGNYQVEYKCLGFKSIEKSIFIIVDKVLSVEVTLEEKPFALGEVTVSNREDPAYSIMRKAIHKAPFYANAIKQYTAEVYIKGNAELLNVGSLVDNFAKKAEGIKLSEFKNQVFVQESFNEIQFTAPDKYKQTVKAFSSSIPDNMNSTDAMGITLGSLYNPKMSSYVSPLNPNAFSYYRFRYEGFYEENGLTINKIKVEPKLKDPILLNGYIYIADNSWHITSAELKSNVYGAKQIYTITYQELGADIYLPITYIIESDVNIFGIQATLNYYASLKYTDIKFNNNAINKLENNIRIKKRNLEIKKDALYTRIADSLATKRDADYWAKIRVIPLDKREITSFSKKDSIQHRLDSARKEHSDSKFSFSHILDGGRIGSDSSSVAIYYEGLFHATPEYNFVDGLWLGQKFSIKSKLDKHTSLEISPYAYYTSARKKLIYGGDLHLSYAPMLQGKLEISAGSLSKDFNTKGIHIFNNAASSILTGKNYNHFYQKDYVSISNSIDISNGIKLSTSMEIAKRSGLSNNTNWTLGKKSNIVPNIFPDDISYLTAYSLRIDYTPNAYYSVKDGAKQYEDFVAPTFFFGYKEAFSSWQTNNARYRMFNIGLHQNIKLSEFSYMDYYVEGGGFIGNKTNIHFSDFQHFNTSNVTINFKSPFSSFMLLDNYTASTNKYWIQNQYNYNSQYLLLKRLPFLQGKMFTESLHLKNLYTPDIKLYTEVGYSINLMKLLSAGIFTSFKKGKYQDFGFRLLFDLDASRKAF